MKYCIMFEYITKGKYYFYIQCNFILIKFIKKNKKKKTSYKFPMNTSMELNSINNKVNIK